MKRRNFVKTTGLASLAIASQQLTYASEELNMHGIIGKLKAAPNERDNLIGILLEGTKNMPGCIQYVVSKDTKDKDAIGVTEVWQDQASHQASISLPKVQEALMKGKPLIASFAERHTIEPVGGQGI